MVMRRIGGAALGVLLGLTVLVAAGAQRPDLDLDVVDLPGIQIAGVASLIAAVLVTGLVRERTVRDGPTSGTAGPTLLIVVVGIALAAGATGLTLQGVEPPPEQQATAEPAPVPVGGADGPGDDERRTTSLVTAVRSLPLVPLLLLAAGVAGVAVAARRAIRRTDVPPHVLATLADDPTLVRARRRLAGEVDEPRAAIIAAFAELEAALERTGRSRAVGETQQELITRSLRDVGVPTAPTTTLADVYARARWSTGTVTDDDVHRAGAALDAVLGALP